jgi:hypothetical protein
MRRMRHSVMSLDGHSRRRVRSHWEDGRMLPINPQLGGILRPLLGTAVAAVVASQSALAQFEVVSVRPSARPDGEAYVQVVPGRLRMQNVAARTLIQLAYGLESYQISGGPSWISSAASISRPRRRGVLPLNRCKVQCCWRSLRTASNWPSIARRSKCPPTRLGC